MSAARNPLHAATDLLEAAAPLDAFVEAARRPAGRLAVSPIGDALRGGWLGHPLHPMLTDIPIGCWTSAWVLDLVGGERAEPAADALVALGVASVVPTALSGWVDWPSLDERRRRVGIVHAGVNALATTAYAASWVARHRGARRAGVRLGHLGAAIATVGGYLGGHLAFAGDRFGDAASGQRPAPDGTERTMAGDEEIVEPDNSTVDDWFGQNVARDQEVADEALEEEGSVEEAEERFEREAHGEEQFREGHPRPEDPMVTPGA